MRRFAASLTLSLCLCAPMSRADTPANDDGPPPAVPTPTEPRPDATPVSAPPPLAAAPAAEPQRSSAFDRVLIQLNWGDDNLLVGAGETRENSPDPNFSRCTRTQIDGVPHRDCSAGRTRLGLYKAVPLRGGLTVSGALVVGLAVVTDPESSQAGKYELYDQGSYLRVAKAFGSSLSREFAVEFYPVDARPLTLGFHPDLEWGTKDEFPRNFRRGLAPGLKLGLDLDGFYVFAGAKSALIKSPLEVELENEGGNRILFSTRTFYGLLGGFGYGHAEGFSAEVNGGFFHKGTLSKEGVIGKPILSGGASLRLMWRQGLPVGLRIASALYQRATSGSEQIIQTPSYEGHLAWAVSGEGTLRVQDLADSSRPNSTALEWSWASHLGFQLRVGNTRLHVEQRNRSLTYIVADVPGLIPYSTLPDGAETFPEMQALVSVDHRLGDFTLALTGGVRMPATYRGPSVEGSGTDPASAGVRTVVVSDADAGGWYILPEGDDAVPVWWAELGFKWAPAKEFALLADILFGRDQNRTQVERDSAGHALRVYTEPNVLSLNLVGQFLF
ncbi:MAG: hypothetical protein H6744_11130 [Deltaproteobacteria bacterium]|nr:hypothetical protein [Deltaproteobacteria bacterium]MCB9787233.1 hypothetical protein [Deltaproteobacteria bacterium]